MRCPIPCCLHFPTELPCVLPVLIYIAVYLSLLVAAYTQFVSNMLVSGMLCLSYCTHRVVFIGVLLCLCEFVHLLTSASVYSKVVSFFFFFYPAAV